MYSTNPLTVPASFLQHRTLILHMTKRDVVGRYRGSILGLLWSFLNPVLMLAVYTFVFGFVFKARWGEGAASKSELALLLFSGLLIHSIFSECLNRAPSLILGNSNYVKKVVFPLEILPWVGLGSALFHTAISVLVLLVFFACVHSYINWTVLFLPLLISPLVLLIMGLSWFLAATAVYLRDVGQTTSIITSMLMFLSPVFYPASAIPEAYRPLFQINPLTFMIEQTRDIIIWGKAPDWVGFGVYSAVSAVVAWAGFYWFQKLRKGFADVL